MQEYAWSDYMKNFRSKNEKNLQQMGNGKFDADFQMGKYFRFLKKKRKWDLCHFIAWSINKNINITGCLADYIRKAFTKKIVQNTDR